MRATIAALALALIPTATVVGERGHGSTRMALARSARSRDASHGGIDAGMLAAASALLLKKALGAALGFALLGFDR